MILEWWAQVADRVAVMYLAALSKKTIVYVLARPMHPYTQGFTGGRRPRLRAWTVTADSGRYRS